MSNPGEKQRFRANPEGGAEPLPAGLRAQRVIETIAELQSACSFPGTLLHVLQVVNDEKSTKHDLAHAIERDPDLTERVLHAANSPLYLTYNARIDESALAVTNLPTAVLKLGFTSIRNIAFTQGICDLGHGGHELGTEIVVHLLVVAELARALGLQRGRGLGEDAYFAGLVHDYGKLALLKTLPLEYLRVAARCRTHRRTALQAEEELLAPCQPILRNHVHTGAELLRLHGLPASIVTAVMRHHEDPIAHRASGTVWTVPSLVALANHLAYRIGYPDGLSEVDAACLSKPELVDLLRVEESVVEQVIRESVSRVDDAIAVARLPVRPQLLERIRRMERSAEVSARDYHGVVRATDEPYGACLTLIDLARSRPSVGFYDFKAHTGLETPALQRFLGRLIEAGYLKVSETGEARLTYQATRKLHEHRPHDVLRQVLLDREEPGANAA